MRNESDNEREIGVNPHENSRPMFVRNGIKNEREIEMNSRENRNR